MSDNTSLALLLARWFDARLHDSVGFCLRETRLYGLEVLDVDGLASHDPLAARMSFLAAAADQDALLHHPDAPRAREFDAAALVVVEWRPAVSGRAPRPGDFTARRRARVADVVLVADGEGATVLRFEHDPDFIVLAPAS